MDVQGFLSTTAIVTLATAACAWPAARRCAPLLTLSISCAVCEHSLVIASALKMVLNKLLNKLRGKRSSDDSTPGTLLGAERGAGYKIVALLGQGAWASV